MRSSGFALGLQLGTALILLAGVAFLSVAFVEVGDASPVGRAGTVVACLIAAVVALAGTVVARRGSSGTGRRITATAVFAVVGIVALMAFLFLFSGGPSIIVGVLLAGAAIMIGQIGYAVRIGTLS